MSKPEDPSATPAGSPPPRGPIVLRIKLRFEDVATFVERFAPNIGRSGLFIRSRTPKVVGTEVRFELRLADDTPVVVGLGVVRWVKEYDPQRPRAVHGMGVEFSRVTRESREVLLRVLEHRKRVGLVDGPGGIPVPATVPGEDDAETRVVRLPTAPAAEAPPGRDDQVTAIRQAPTRRLDGRRPTRPPTTRGAGPDDSPTVIAPALSAQIAAAGEMSPIELRFDADLPTRVAPALSAQIAAAAERVPAEGMDSGPTLARPAPLPPREPRRLRPSPADLVARAASLPPPLHDAPPVESLAPENLDVETTLRRARSLAGADPERELRLLLDRSAAPLPITIDDASARLAAMVGGSAVAARRARSGRISSPPPIVADGTQETRPVEARRPIAEVPEPPIEPPTPTPPPTPSPLPSPPPSPSPLPPPVPPRPSPPPVEIPPVPRPETPPASPPPEIPPPFSPPPVAPDSEPIATREALDPLDADTRIDLGFDLSGLSRMATSDPGVETTVISPAPLVDIAAEDIASDDDAEDPDDPDILVGVPLPRTRRDSPLPGVALPGAEPRARRETPRFLADLADEEPTSLVPPRRAERRSDPPPMPVAAVKSAAADMWDLAPARQTSSGSIDITELVAHLDDHAGDRHFGTRPDSDSADRHALGAEAMDADDMLHSGVERLDRTPSRGGPRRRIPDTHPPDLASFADPPDAMSDEVRASIPSRPGRPSPVEQRLSTVDDIEAALDGLDLDGLDDIPAPRHRAPTVAAPAQHAHQPGGRPGRPRAPTDDEIEIDIDLDGLDD